MGVRVCVCVGGVHCKYIALYLQCVFLYYIVLWYGMVIIFKYFIFSKVNGFMLSQAQERRLSIYPEFNDRLIFQH
jgi:hypothetical protein